MYGIESIRPRRPITLPELPVEEEVSKGPSRLYTQSALDACVQFTARSVLILRPEQSLALISMRNLRMASLISSAGWRYLTAGVLGLAISPVQEGARLFVCGTSLLGGCLASTLTGAANGLERAVRCAAVAARACFPVVASQSSEVEPNPDESDACYYEVDAD